MPKTGWAGSAGTGSPTKALLPAAVTVTVARLTVMLAAAWPRVPSDSYLAVMVTGVSLAFRIFTVAEAPELVTWSTVSSLEVQAQAALVLCAPATATRVKSASP